MGTIKDIIDIIKDLRDMAKEASNQPMIDLAVEIQDKIFDLKNDLEILRDENRSLKKKVEESNIIMQIEQDLVPHKQAFYTRKSDKVERLYCARCWDKDNVLIQLQGHINWGQYGCKDVYCPECKVRLCVYKQCIEE